MENAREGKSGAADPAGRERMDDRTRHGGCWGRGEGAIIIILLAWHLGSLEDWRLSLVSQNGTTNSTGWFPAGLTESGVQTKDLHRGSRRGAVFR